MHRSILVAALVPLVSALGQVKLKNRGCPDYFLWDDYIDGVTSLPDPIDYGDERSIPYSSAQSNKTLVFSVWPAEGSDKRRRSLEPSLSNNKRQEDNPQIPDSYNYMDFEVTISEDNQKVTYGFAPGGNQDIFRKFTYRWILESTSAGTKKCISNFDGCTGIEVSAEEDVVFSACVPEEEIEDPSKTTQLAPTEPPKQSGTYTSLAPYTQTTDFDAQTTSQSTDLQAQTTSQPAASVVIVTSHAAGSIVTETSVIADSPVSCSQTQIPMISASAIPSPTSNGTSVSSLAVPPIATAAASSIGASMLAISVAFVAITLF